MTAATAHPPSTSQAPGSPSRVPAVSKSSTVFRDEEVDEMVVELEELRKKNPGELRSLVFCKSNFAMAVVTSKGCRITFSNGSVYLDVPPGAIEEDQILYIYRPVRIHVAGTTSTSPGPPPNFISYATPIHCGPVGTKFNTPATIQFGHCAVIDEVKGPVGLYAMKRDSEASPWEAMQPDRFEVDTKSVKVKMHEMAHCTLGFPLKKEGA